MTGKRIRLIRDIPSLAGIFKAGTVMEILTVNVGDGYESVGPLETRHKFPRITGLKAGDFEFVGDGEPIRVIGSAESLPVKATAGPVVKPLVSEIGSLEDLDSLDSLDDLDLEGLV